MGLEGLDMGKTILMVPDLSLMFGVTADAIRKRFQRGDFGRCCKLGRKWVITRRRLLRLTEG